MENNDTIFSDIIGDETEATSSQKSFVGLIDLGMSFLVLFTLYKILPWSFILKVVEINSFLFFLILMTIIILFRFLFLLVFGKTVGMMICGVKLLNPGMKPLSMKDKLLSAFRTRSSTLKYYKAK